MSMKDTWNYWALRAGKADSLRRGARLAALLVSLLSLLAIAWRSATFWDALSPVTHKKELYQLAGTYKIDPLLLAAIVSAESSFFPYAESHKGALGLMQLLPATAAQMAAELKIDYQDSEDLYREDLNLLLGTHYFSKLLNQFDGHLVLSLAAYNAGPGNVRAWRLDTFGRDQEEVLASIPVPATKAYVRAVLKDYRTFKAMQSLKRLLQGGETL